MKIKEVRSHNGEETVSARSTHPMIRDNFYIFRTSSAILHVINTHGYTGIGWALPALRDQCHVSRE